MAAKAGDDDHPDRLRRPAMTRSNQGIVANLNPPEGAILTSVGSYPSISGKRVELLHELVPTAAAVPACS